MRFKKENFELNTKLEEEKGKKPHFGAGKYRITEEKGRNIALEQELKAEKVELQSMLEEEKGKNKALVQVIKNVKVGWKIRMEHLMKIATLEEDINILEKIL